MLEGSDHPPLQDYPLKFHTALAYRGPLEKRVLKISIVGNPEALASLGNQPDRVGTEINLR